MQVHRPQQPHDRNASRPKVSVLMACFRSGPYIQDLELIVVDDGSDDDGPAIAEAAARHDGRVRLLRSGGNRGPAHARNLAIDAAGGEWLAVVDADDMMHPERLERLLAAAGQLNADIVFDDLLQFHEDGSPVAFLIGEILTEVTRVRPEDWILAGSRPDLPPLGYLKPMLRSSLVHRLRYDEALRIGEDYDLILRLLLSGANAWVIPEPWYFYRKHTASISHRMSVADYSAAIASQKAVVGQAGSADVEQALAQRLRRLESGLSLARLVAALKARDPVLTARLVATDPAQLWRLGQALASGHSNRRRARATVQGKLYPAQRLHLTAAEAPQHLPGAEVIHAPPFEPPERLVSPGRHRRVWADIAGRSSAAPVEVSCDSPAGRYAAGFVLRASGVPAARPPLEEVDLR
jgi:succinoglycan biosynthesis protein ExoO